ncbi:MAG: thioredoxin [Agathobacter sp.]|nr:thioredoxin [Agathobacter sp.]
MSEITLNSNNFEKEVLNNEGLILVDFWASWCGPCKMIAPVVHEIAEENADIKVGKVNVDEAMELAQKYQVVSIPTLILFKDGKPIKQHIGFANKSQIEEMWK